MFPRAHVFIFIVRVQFVFESPFWKIYSQAVMWCLFQIKCQTNGNGLVISHSPSVMVMARPKGRLCVLSPCVQVRGEAEELKRERMNN